MCNLRDLSNLYRNARLRLTIVGVIAVLLAALTWLRSVPWMNSTSVCFGEDPVDAVLRQVPLIGVTHLSIAKRAPSTHLTYRWP